MERTLDECNQVFFFFLKKKPSRFTFVGMVCFRFTVWSFLMFQTAGLGDAQKTSPASGLLRGHPQSSNWPKVFSVLKSRRLRTVLDPKGFCSLRMRDHHILSLLWGAEEAEGLSTWAFWEEQAL